MFDSAAPDMPDHMWAGGMQAGSMLGYILAPDLNWWEIQGLKS